MIVELSTQQIRNDLKAARSELQQSFLHHGNPRRLLKAHAQIVDKHLCMAWQMVDMPESLSLIAVGGYGRTELYPKSDIDLLILLPCEPDEQLQKSLQEVIGIFWDIGLEVGHSIRTVDECIAECSDITVQTNLLESRLLTGSHELYQQLSEKLLQYTDCNKFFIAKQQEQEQRYQRFLDTDYNLEPNLKESPGGLRDLQTIFWISRACGLGISWKEYSERGMLTLSEARAFSRHESFIQTLRIRLHYLAGRREDRLLFDFQTALAEQMQISATENRRASEHLMQQYYRTKKAIQQLNSVLLQNMRASLFPKAQNIQPINERFVAHNDLLEARSENLFEQEPSAILESFLLMEKHPRLLGFSASTLRSLWRAQKHIDAKFRNNPNNQQLFMQILREPQGLTHVLRRMNQTGILGRYIPPFGRIVGQMQHDLFHVFTVDEHILMVVRNLRRLTVPEYAHELPLCSKLIRDFARPEVLYIAGLFHDIAKGRGGDHSQLGKADAMRFCRQHGLTQEDSDLVVWLVEQHLTMSSTAQKQDLSDQDVIAAFAGRVRNDRYLVALYLLTVSDIRGTSAKVWNAWKGKLLEDLFWSTRRFLVGGKIADQIGEIRTKAREVLSLYAISPEVYELLWAQLDADYFLRHEPQEIAWHTRLLAHRVNSDKPVIKARLSNIGEGMQVMVYSPDQPYLFARICEFFEQINYNIMEAKVHTTQHGYALDSFLVLSAGKDETVYRDLMSYIEYELGKKLENPAQLNSPRIGRASRQQKHFPIAPEAVFSTDDKGNHMLSITAADRPGLLARIAHVLALHHIIINSAKINTLGARAEDTFWISGKALQHITDKTAIADELKNNLT